MILHPICEPVELAPGAPLLVERVEYLEDGPELGHFLHFHDVSELVVFERVQGSFVAEGRRYPLVDGCVIFAPSMRHHDFELQPGPKAWRLLQIDPYLIEQLALRSELGRLSRAFCIRPDEQQWNRLAMLLEWLSETVAEEPCDPLVYKILELIVALVVAAPEDEGDQAGEEIDHVERLLPALERLRLDPTLNVGLEEAAQVCSLSPAYFSRRFKRVFGMNFSDYARAYRLHLAARRILSSRASVSNIAYGLGFSSASHFTQLFRERFGMTPSDYRKTIRERLGD